MSLERYNAIFDFDADDLYASSCRYPNIFGSYSPPLETLLDAYGIQRPPDQECYHDLTDDWCEEWHKLPNGGMALATLNTKMEKKTVWMKPYPPIKGNELYVLSCLPTPSPMNQHFLETLLKYVAEATKGQKEDQCFVEVRALIGVYGSMLYLSNADIISAGKVTKLQDAIINQKCNPMAAFKNFEFDLGLCGLLMSLRSKWKDDNFLGLLRSKKYLAELNRPKLIADVPLDMVTDLVDALPGMEEQLLRAIYSILVDWRRADSINLTGLMMVRELTRFLLESHPEGRWREVEPFFKTIVEDGWELRKSTAQVIKMCENNSIPQSIKDRLKCKSDFKVLAFGNVVRAVLKENHSIDKEVQLFYGEEEKKLETWFKIRLILHHTGQTSKLVRNAAVQDLKNLEVPTPLWQEISSNEGLLANLHHHLLDLVSSSQLTMVMGNADKLEAEGKSHRGVLMDPKDYVSLLVQPNWQKPQTVSLTLLLLTGKITMEALLAALPEYHPFYKALAGTYGDHVTKQLDPKFKVYFEGGYTTCSTIVYIDALRELLLDPPSNCPIPKGKLHNLMRAMLIFQLVSMEKSRREFSLKRYLVGELQIGEVLFLPAIVYRHGFSYSVTRLGVDAYQVRVFNSGSGVKTHQKTADGQLMPFREFEVSRQILEDHNYFANFHAPSDSIDEVGYLKEGRERVFTEEELQKWAKGTQKSGSCHAKAILVWLRMQWDDPLHGLWFKAFRFNLHAKAIRKTLGRFTVEFDKMAGLSTTWSPDLSKESCQRVASETVPYFRAILRHFSMRLAQDLKKLKVDDHGAMDLISGAVLDDPDLLDCLGVNGETAKIIGEKQRPWKEIYLSVGEGKGEKRREREDADAANDTAADDEVNGEDNVKRQRKSYD